MRSPIRMLRLAQVMELTGLRKTTIYELQAAGRLPHAREDHVAFRGMAGGGRAELAEQPRRGERAAAVEVASSTVRNRPK
jgi:hypothetical protein